MQSDDSAGGLPHPASATAALVPQPTSSTPAGSSTDPPRPLSQPVSPQPDQGAAPAAATPPQPSCCAVPPLNPGRPAPDRTGTDLAFVRKALGERCYERMRSAGYSISFDPRSASFGAYTAVFYTLFPLSGRRAGLAMLPRSRVRLRDPGDHARVICAVYNSHVLEDMGAVALGGSTPSLQPLPAPEPAPPPAQHSSSSSSSDADEEECLML